MSRKSSSIPRRRLKWGAPAVALAAVLAGPAVAVVLTLVATGTAWSADAIGYVGPASAARCSFDDAETAFTWRTGARELATMVTVPAENVRGPGGVPDELRIIGEELGEATLFVQIGHQHGLRLDDSKEMEGGFGWLLVAIEPPDGHPALHRYALSFATDVKQLDRRLRQVGMTTLTSPQISLEEEEKGGAPFTETEARGRVWEPRTKDSYGVTAAFAAQPALPLAPVHQLLGDFGRGAILWHKRGSDVIRVSFDVALHSWRFADSARLEAPEGSTVAGLGATSGDAPAAMIAGEVRGPVEVGTLSCPEAAPEGRDQR